MEKLFKMKYWDYNNQRFDVKGYICLSSSIAQGFLTVFLTEVAHRPIEHHALGLPVIVSIVFVLIATLLFVADTTEFVKTVLDLTKMLDAMTDMRAELDDIQVQMALLGAETSERIVEAGKEAAARLSWMKSGVASHAVAFKDDTAERLNELAENTMERTNGLVEGIAEKMSGLMENTVGKATRTAERLSELTEDAVTRVSSTPAQRAEGAQQAIQCNELNKGVIQEHRDKLTVLSQRLVPISEKRHMLSNHMDFYHRDIPKGNLIVFSSRFAEAPKELHEVANRKDPDECHIR